MHLVAVYGYQGSDDDAEKLGLTDQLFEAVLSELAVVSHSLGISIWSPPRSLAC